ncbi:MAG: LysM peptidoglycan-binding domain-containing protein [Patescibacteria group bacterium]|nr:LysM peptidoglycan-binding domain-containing protein [Patescibacteria group bacterium]
MKVAAALSGLVTAICLALLFWGDPSGLTSSSSQPLELRTSSESAPTPPALRKPDLFSPLLPTNAGHGQVPTVLTPSASEAEPPSCGSEGFPVAASSRQASRVKELASWGTAAGVMMPELHHSPESRTDETPRTHTVVDGDTLSGLAARYLGAADRYLDIYQWNSDVLANPDVLPIGQLLRIPPKTAQQPAALQVIERPMVPIRDLQADF